MKATARIGLSFAMATLALALGGCASYRIQTTLKPTKLPVSTQNVYTIAEARYVIDTNINASALSPFTTYSIFGSLKNDLNAAAVAAYPAVFSTNAPNAIPLTVIVTCTENRNDMNEGAACISCLTLTIVPLMTSDGDTYVVEATCPDPALSKRLARPVEFSRTDVSWLSIFPTGWIPVPGSGGDRAWGMDSAIAKAKTDTLRGVVEALVTNLRREAL